MIKPHAKCASASAPVLSIDVISTLGRQENVSHFAQTYADTGDTIITLVHFFIASKIEVRLSTDQCLAFENITVITDSEFRKPFS